MKPCPRKIDSSESVRVFSSGKNVELKKKGKDPTSIAIRTETSTMPKAVLTVRVWFMWV
jgi:hypothetical protein